MGPTGLRWTRAQAAEWLHQHYQVERVADLDDEQAEAALRLLRKISGTRPTDRNTAAA
jgi:hypothetical protein